MVEGGSRLDLQVAFQVELAVEIVERALLDRELTDTEKRVFTLHYGDDVPLQTITRLLGLKNSSGAKAYLVSARRKLARALQRWRACEKLSA